MVDGVARSTVPRQIFLRLVRDKVNVEENQKKMCSYAASYLADRMEDSPHIKDVILWLLITMAGDAATPKQKEFVRRLLAECEKYDLEDAFTKGMTET